MIVAAEKIYNQIPMHIKLAANLPINYLDLTFDQMMFVNEFFFSSSKNIKVNELKEMLEIALKSADSLYSSLNVLEDIVNDADQ